MTEPAPPWPPLDSGSRPPEVERCLQLFRFLRAYAELHVPIKRTLAEELWVQRLADLPRHPSISIGEVILQNKEPEDGETESQDEQPLLRVRRPQLTRAPGPPGILVAFVRSGWEQCDGEVSVEETRNVERDGQTTIERFDEDPARVAGLAAWRTKWEQWAINERPAVRAMRVFERLFDLRGRIERDGEQVELMLGDGRLRWKRAAGLIDHPILLQRVVLEFDASVPEFRIMDAERGPELYTPLLYGNDSLSPANLKALRTELEQGAYHPLAGDATSGYLRELAQRLDAKSTFEETLTASPPGEDPAVARDQVLFLRTRTAGFAAAFDRVLQAVETGMPIPIGLTRLVGVEPPPPLDTADSTHSPWSAPQDILLSKRANEEQIRAARALDRHGAVLVQGPPGTGKTHTIANLIGHLVAHGKRVLVTSDTTKALSVLRDEVVKELRPLCVAVLGNDLNGRKQMQDAVRGIVSRLGSSDMATLEHDVARFTESRNKLNARIETLTRDLRTTREMEYEPIIVAGESTDPAQAARWVRDNADGNDWIPGPLAPGVPLPIADAELRELYATNTQLTREEDEEITGGLPPADAMPEPRAFGELVTQLAASESSDFSPLWERPASEAEMGTLEHLTRVVTDMAGELARLEPWQRSVVAAGHTGGSESQLWVDLGNQVREAATAWEKSRSLLVDHATTIPASIELDDVRKTVTEMGAHLANGGKLGALRLMLKPEWKAVVTGCRVNGHAPNRTAEFRAIGEYVALQQRRQRLALRWERQAELAGLPKFADIATPPEPILNQYASQFDSLLDWWRSRWTEVGRAMRQAGFDWQAFRDWQVARSAPATPFDRDAAILQGALEQAVVAHSAVAQRTRAVRLLQELDELLAKHGGPACSALRDAARAGDPVAYDEAWSALQQIIRKGQTWETRRRLVGRLAMAAATWTDAIREREGTHGGSKAPGDSAKAWRWRQLAQELQRRADLDDVRLARQLEETGAQLRDVTTQLIDRLAWLEQHRRTGLQAQQALQGWAAIQKKIGRGTGKRVPALQAAARQLLDEARDAVPVWIMPLVQVADSFDATGRRFDVVIIDEASQAGIKGLLAWYLGDRVLVVGDNEQVSPLAVGQDVTAVDNLVNQHLTDVPNPRLYAGRTSVYDLAQTCFGGTIRLREHFRCVPDIIGFSNELCYDFEIRPLRNPGSAPTPHVVEHVVHPSLRPMRDSKEKTNLAEARVVVALLKAATELPEYSGKTMGAITLLGDKQADLIQDLAVRVIGAVELEGRRFVAGNSAQFQGDQRNLMFLSMVDTPADGPLMLQQRPETKQRYNVAASRAKDQLWLVHSLDPNRDLKAGDLRRKLIEFVRDPGARRRAKERAESRAESPFEKAVLQRLIAAGYAVEPQVWVGGYRIDMVVSDGTRQIAVECDGDRFHGADEIPADMARQAILERVGWRFVRIRGTRFYRQPDETMGWALGELAKLGVGPTSAAEHEPPPTDVEAMEFREKVVRRAWEIMGEEGWLADAGEGAQTQPPTENRDLGGP